MLQAILIFFLLSFNNSLEVCFQSNCRCSDAPLFTYTLKVQQMLQQNSFFVSI